MQKTETDLLSVFALERPSETVFVGRSPYYHWGRIYGGLVVAQAVWAATQTVDPLHAVHSLHAYLISFGDLARPVRYQVDELRSGRSFSTRRVVAWQEESAILTLGCSFQAGEPGPSTHSAEFPDGVTPPEGLDSRGDIGVDQRLLPDGAQPGVRTWLRYPASLPDDARVHACALAYLSDVDSVRAVVVSHRAADDERLFLASLDHALWFHRRVQATDWLLFDTVGQGMTGTRGLATGRVFQRDGTLVATTAQEALVRVRQ